MSKMDLLMGFILVFSWIFLVFPVLLSATNSRAGYIETVLAGLVLTMLCVLVVVIGTSIWVAIAYFIGDLKPSTPLTDFIEWVNSI